MTPLFRPVAEHALLVEFGTHLSDETHAAVLRLDRTLSAQPFPGFAEAVPAYVNLLVRFDPLTTDHHAVEAALRDRLDQPAEATHKSALHPVEITYDGQDLPEVAARTGLSVAEVIQSHLSGQYQVALYGFAPGYAYLSGLPDRIRLPRKDAAIRDVPAGSVIIAAGQCIVTTLIMPTGWWIIGHSPTPILRPIDPRPFLFDVGDRVQFRQAGP